MLDQITKGLWDHQAQAVRTCQQKDNYALFFEMGTGKSATAINIIRLWCMQYGGFMSGMILCPPIVIKQWQEEFFKFSKLGPYTVPLVGTGMKRLETLKKAIDNSHLRKPIFITNYETMLMVPIQRELKKANLDFLVCDESHKLKNFKAKRTKAVAALAQPIKKKLILTGSPVLNSPMDLFSQYLILDGGKTFGNNFWVFQARYFVDLNITLRGRSDKYFPKFVPRKGTNEAFHQLLKDTSAYVKKDDCLDLPPLVKKTIEVDMAPDQKRTYKELAKDLVSYLEGGAVTADIVLVKLLRLRQIVSGFTEIEVIDKNEVITKKIIYFDNVPRLAALKEMLENVTPHHKVIVWASFIANYKMIREVCEEIGVDYVEIRGGQTAKKTQEAIEDFRSKGAVRVCIANQKAGGTGLNLVEASYSAYYSKTHSYEEDIQSEARNRRGGSEIHSKITRVDFLTPQTIDGEIIQSLERKAKMATDILEGKNVAVEPLNVNALKDELLAILK